MMVFVGLYIEMYSFIILFDNAVIGCQGIFKLFIIIRFWKILDNEYLGKVMEKENFDK